MIFLFLLGYLLLLTSIGYSVNALLLPLFGRWWRLFVAPGVVLHELAHALACVLTGAHVVEINFWKASGGHVIHTQPRIQLIGPVLIAFAPTLVMTLVLFGIAPVLSGIQPDLAWTAVPPNSVSGAVGNYFVALWAIITQLNWLSWMPWLLVYLMLNVAVTIAPSRMDLDNTKWAFLGLVIVTALFGQLFAIQAPLLLIWRPVATSLLFLGLALAWAVGARIVGLFVIQGPVRR